MELKNNIILITGGSSGIGLELTKRLSETNVVIICGRTADKLEAAKKKFPKIETFQCDISIKSECERLVSWVNERHAKLNILINNAAIAHVANFKEDKNAVEKAAAEIQTNLMAPIILSKHCIPILERNKNPKIINITTGLVYAPRAIYPFYNATKAALHSFTQVLRLQLKSSAISIVEVMFPAVDTPWHSGNVPDIAITVERAVAEMLAGLENEKYEIKVGKVKLLQRLSRIAPSFALRKINGL
ncbi:SDR family NAD(P)-dependent oxidoreductase [Maribacter sp.]|nr:SDR family NAD(P)-dependent oxidoreductase [Maribacter sp.]